MSLIERSFLALVALGLTAAMSFVAGYSTSNQSWQIEEAVQIERAIANKAALDKEISTLKAALARTTKDLGVARANVTKELKNEDKQAMADCLLPADALGLHERFRAQADRSSSRVE